MQPKLIGTLFTWDMVEAMQERRKTETRRLAVPQPGPDEWIVADPLSPTGWSVVHKKKQDTRPISHRFGKPGDILWVRETHWEYGKWIRVSKDPDKREWRGERRFKYFDQQHSFEPATDLFSPGYHKLPGIHMPKEACRLWLTILSIEPGQLKGITEQQAIDEGIKPAPEDLKGLYEEYGGGRRYTSGEFGLTRSVYVQPINSYKSLWNSIHPDNVFASNPWTWRIVFRPDNDL